MRIAFYAPMKPVDHPVPSGEREMARLLVAALRHGGHEVEIASSLRSYRKTPHDDEFSQSAADEIVRISKQWQKTGAPDIWFCYHPYYKAPDYLALALHQRFSIPVVTAEASVAGKRDRDQWQASQRPVNDLLAIAAKNFSFTAIDREGVAMLAKPGSMVDLPPFIDISKAPIPKQKPSSARVKLVTVAMMRDGVKLASYRALAKALQQITDLDWQLTIIGDGKQRGTVEGYFAPLGERVIFTGLLGKDEVELALQNADIFVWPGIGEAYGMVYLEAAAHGLASVAYNNHGVSAVVHNNQSGLLVPFENAPANGETSVDIAAYAATLAKLIQTSDLRLELGQKAAFFATQERSLAAAAKILSDNLQQVVRDKA